jgi:hypothetical protein
VLAAGFYEDELVYDFASFMPSDDEDYENGAGAGAGAVAVKNEADVKPVVKEERSVGETKPLAVVQPVVKEELATGETKSVVVKVSVDSRNLINVFYFRNFAKNHGGLKRFCCYMS